MDCCGFGPWTHVAGSPGGVVMEHQSAVGRDRPRALHELPGDPVPPDVVLALAAVPGLTGASSDVLDEMGYRLAVPGTKLRPLREGDVLIGRALTLRYLPSRRQAGAGKLAHLSAAELARPGDVLVISAPVSIHVSVLGGEAARLLASAGIAGVVADGYIRDLDEVAATNLRVWYRGPTPISGRGRLEVGEINGAVEIGAIAVEPGDIVVADRSGVTFVPPAAFGSLLKRVLPSRTW